MIKLAAPRPWRQAKAAVSYKEVSSSSEDEFTDVDSSFNLTVTEEELVTIDAIKKDRRHQKEVFNVTKGIGELLIPPALDDSDVTMPEAAVAEVDFEDENAEDGEKAIEYTRTLKLEFAQDEVEFWFTQLENEMFTCSVKSQWLKRCVLVKNLPPKIQADVKALLTLKKSEAPTNVYKVIKTEILRIHAPKQEESYKKALSRVLTGLPSQLGEQQLNDICQQPIKLSCGCCARALYTLWSMQLPQAVRGHIANMKFDQNTYREVFEAADKIYLSTKSTDLSAPVAAVVNTDMEATGEVAALRPKPRNNRNNRGSRNGSGTARGGGNNKPGSQSNEAKPRGPRHSSNPPSSCCDNHFRWGASSWFCLAPLSCPWKDKCVTRPEKKKSDNN